MIKPPPLNRQRKKDQCTDDCPMDNPCTLNRHVVHVWHVCSDPDCHCHTRARYQRELAVLQTTQAVPSEVAP